MKERTDLNKRANELLRSAPSMEQWLEAMGVARRVDGASATSTLNATVYTAPERPKKCEQCGRPTKFFEGCSVVECPMRKPITAQEAAR